MHRDFIEPSALTGLLSGYRPGARPASLTRLAGASKKGVYRLVCSDGSTAIVYAWSATENYWPAVDDQVSDDPFADATGPDLLAASHAALAAAGVRTPQIYAWDRSRGIVEADLALVEDIDGGSLEQLMAADPAAAADAIGLLGLALQAMRSIHSPSFGKVGPVSKGHAPRSRRAEDVILDRARRHLAGACARSARLAAARSQIAELLATRHAEVQPRRDYRLVHGELGPDHVLLADEGQPVIIDIEGLTYFDVEWEHAFLRLRFRPADCDRLGLGQADPDRVAFYQLAQRISLIEGPLRIAETDYPDREWMLDLAEYQTAKVLAEL